MCGIVGYIGKKPAAREVLTGLLRLEYRGYDSAGVAVLYQNHITHFKKTGAVKNVRLLVEQENPPGTTAIGHTRWATHGEPTEINAHPHRDCRGTISVVHNGIVENHRELKSRLEKSGHVFSSATDTEVIAHLIEEFEKTTDDFSSAIISALKLVEGAYALAILNAREDKIYATRLSSPLVIGIREDEYRVASDPSALIEATKKVIYLGDGEIAEITRDGVTITDYEKRPAPAKIETLDWSVEQAQKGAFPHFMLKEIYEAPDVVRAALAGRLKATSSIIRLGGLESEKSALQKIERLIILACGTSYYAGLVGEYVFEEIAGIPTKTQLASEFRYRAEPLTRKTAAIAISQSGETADTLGALRKAKNAGLLTLGVVNVVGSTIARETDAGVYNHAGPELGVASTKAFISQLTILHLMALLLARGDSQAHSRLMRELENIPRKIGEILKCAENIETIARKYYQYNNFLFVGRKYNYPVALEGALKLKEVSYAHAEGYAAGEMKHGPIALVGPECPVVAVVPTNSVSEKMYSNIEEVKARRAPIIAIATEGDTKITALANDVFFIPKTEEPLEPLLSVIPLQLLAYFVGVLRGHDVDKPRNLAKSVTVE